MARNIITIAFGEDISEDKFELDVRKTSGSSEFVTKKVKFSEAIEECFS